MIPEERGFSGFFTVDILPGRRGQKGIFKERDVRIALFLVILQERYTNSEEAIRNLRSYLSRETGIVFQKEMAHTNMFVFAYSYPFSNIKDESIYDLRRHFFTMR